MAKDKKPAKKKKKKPAFKVGDKIIHFGKVHRIFKIEKKKNEKGKQQRIIYFKPYFKTKENSSLVCSIPQASVDKARIRKPISKKRLKKILKKLSQEVKEPSKMNISRAKKIIAADDLDRIVNVLRRLWWEKIDEETNFTKSRKRVLRNGIKRLTQEIAFVSDQSRRKARKKIKAALKKSTQKIEKEAKD